MTRKTPIFPLPLVVYPGERLNLHIFEERYRQLIADAETEGLTFCVATVIEDQLLPIATEVELTEIARRYPTGESDIRTTGRSVCLLEDKWRVLPGKLYPGGLARELPIEMEEDPEINVEIVRRTRGIYRELGVDKEIRSAYDGFRTYDIAHYVGLQLKQEYELLTLRRASARQQYLLDHLKKIRPELREAQRIRERAQLNGHFKDLVPPKW